MRTYLFLIVLVLPFIVNAQTPSQNQNYILTTSYQNGYFKGQEQNATNTEKISTINYFDGLGRSIQSIAVRAGGISQDIVTFIDYDKEGRQAKDYLPYAATTNGGAIRTDALSATNSFYDASKYDADFPGMTTSTINPYSQKLFEASPLNRILEQTASGSSWKAGTTFDVNGHSNGYTIKFGNQVNNVSEVRMYSVVLGSDYTPTLNFVAPFYYPAGELYKNIIKDENWKIVDGLNKTTEEFKDRQGRLILKRTYNASAKHDTYYVYDDYGNLTYVIPPKASEVLYSETHTGAETYSVYFNQSVFTGTSSGGGSVQVSITGDEFKVAFSASFVSSRLNGIPQDLNAPCTLPDMFLGYIQTSPNYGNTHTASIENGKLKLTDINGLSITGFSGTLINTLSTNCTASLMSYVLEPTVLNELCYQYKYDSRNRLVEKKIPGKDWEYIVYNKLDQPILTQDANLKSQSKWLFTKYDVFGRVAYTGIINSGSIRSTLQTAADATISQFVTKNTAPTTIAGTTIYYDNGAYPILAGTDEIQTINYYDNYTFDKDILTIPATSEGQAIINYNNLSQGLTKGLATGSKVRVLGTTSWITTITGYDAKARTIYAASRNNYLSTTDVVTSLLDFVGKVDKTTATHTKTGNNSITTVDLFTYDHAGRLTKQTQAINGAATPEVIAENTYDELGQLTVKGVGGKTSRLQTVNYAYNIRGWLKQINDPNILGTDLFGFKINYNTASHGATPLYNGNISETEWKTQNDNLLRWYKYGYDNLNRITSGIDNSADTRYSLSTVAYDKNGNIANLTRRGQTNVGATTFGVMDQLTYTYQANSNKLIIVSDAGNDTFGFKDDQIGTGADITTDYTYDANGNMLKDLNKAMTSNILYNHLNLPTKVTFASGNISYIYDATGVKLEKVVTEGTAITRTKYAGNFIYEKIGTATDVLKFFNTAEGYVEPNGSTYNYVYQYKDHLGNIRLSYKDISLTSTPSLQIVEENNYYPFGLKHKGYNMAINGTHHKYMFGGKEYDESFQTLNTYDFGARNYDPALGRWMNIDPLAEQMRRHSPYNYAFNNPIFFIDYDGMAPDPIYDKNTNLIGDDGKDEGKIHIVYNNSQAREIKNQTKGGNNAIDLSGKDVVTLNGGGATVDGVVASIEAQGQDTGRDPNSSDAGLHEEGGHTQADANGNVTAVAWEPGPKKSETGNGTINLFNGTSPRDYPSSNELADYWHVHTSKTQEVGQADGTVRTFRGSMTPSGNATDAGGDTGTARNLQSNGYKATAIQVGTSSGTKVNFYNGSGVITTMSIKNFKKLKDN